MVCGAAEGWLGVGAVAAEVGVAAAGEAEEEGRVCEEGEDEEVDDCDARHVGNCFLWGGARVACAVELEADGDEVYAFGGLRYARGCEVGAWGVFAGAGDVGADAGVAG